MALGLRVSPVRLGPRARTGNLRNRMWGTPPSSADCRTVRIRRERHRPRLHQRHRPRLHQRCLPRRLDLRRSPSVRLAENTERCKDSDRSGNWSPSARHRWAGRPRWASWRCHRRNHCGCCRVHCRGRSAECRHHSGWSHTRVVPIVRDVLSVSFHPQGVERESAASGEGSDPGDRGQCPAAASDPVSATDPVPARDFGSASGPGLDQDCGFGADPVRGCSGGQGALRAD